MKWENTTNETVLEAAREEIRRELAADLRGEQGPSRGDGVVRSRQASRLSRPIRWGRRYTPRGAAAGTGIPCQRPEPGGGSHQQGDDRDTAQVLWQAASKPGSPNGQGLNRRRLEGRTAGLAEDVRYYGKWMRDEAVKRIGHLYPKIEVTAEMAQERPRPEALLGLQAHRHRMALGSHRQESQPGLCRRGRATGLYLRALYEEAARKHTSSL